MTNKLKEYYDNPALSQSKLKLLLGHPKKFLEERETKEARHFIIGSAVDAILTGESDSEFDNSFYVSDLENKPSELIMGIIKYVYENTPTPKGDLNTYLEIILEACNVFSYNSKWKDETRINKILEHFYYWDSLVNSEGKTIISQSEYEIICSVAMSLKSNEYTAPYFRSDKNIEILYQLPIYFTHQEIDCKALLDMVIVDHKNKTIQIIDIKTMGDYTSNFKYAFKNHRYDIQMAMYTIAIEYWRRQEKLEEYKILFPKFLVESTISPGEPSVYTVDENTLLIATHGLDKFKSMHGTTFPELDYLKGKNRPIIGLYDLFRLYKYYQENGFEVSKEYREQKGNFILNWIDLI